MNVKVAMCSTYLVVKSHQGIRLSVMSKSRSASSYYPLSSSLRIGRHQRRQLRLISSVPDTSTDFPDPISDDSIVEDEVVQQNSPWDP